MKKFTFIVFVLLAFCWQTHAQSIVIGTGTNNTTSTGSDPIDGYYAAFKYQVVYTAAQLSASLTPYDEITALGWSIAGDYGGGDLLGYTIKMGHTTATNSASHDASSTIVVKNAFDYDPTVTVAGVFDMIPFDTNFVWNGVDNVLVEICSDGSNAYTSPYGIVRATTATSGSRSYRSDTFTACDKNTNSTNGNRPNVQFDYIDGTPPSCFDVTALNIDSFNASSATVSWIENNGATDWEIAFQPSGAGEPAGSGTPTTSNPHIQLSLTGSTVYDVYVRTDCGGGDYSDWSGPATFTTDPSTVPACVTAYTATPDVACGNYDTALSWTGVIADGYNITVGTTSGGNDILDNVDLGNVTSTTISSQTANTTYFYTISPYNIVGTNTGCAEQTYTTFVTGCLCESVPTSNDNSGISNVRVGLTDYASGDVTYFDHSGTAEQLGQGLTANLDITFETGFTYSTNVWIDFDDNLTFDPSEKVHSGLSAATNPTTYQADFTMPAAAALGVHKMRIVTADNNTLDDPCYNGTFGVTLDFDIEVTAVACVPATVDSVTVVENCAAGTYVVDVVVSDIGSGDGLGTTLFIWGASFDPLVLGTNTAGPFTIGGAAENITILDALDNTCSINLGDFTYDDCPPPLPVGVSCTGDGPVVVFTADFEDTTGWTGDINVAGDDDWEQGDAGSGGTGPDAAFNGTANSYIYYEASGSNTSTASAVSPAINLTTAVEAVELAFYMHAFGADMGTLNVGVSITGAGGPFTNEFSWTGEYQTAEDDAWAPVGVDLSAYMGQVIHLEFSQTGSGTGFAGDMAIDAITVTACGSFCLDPSDIIVSNVTDSTVDFAWTANGSETDWRFVVQAAGTGITGAGATTSSNPLLWSGLSGNTDYEFYVRADCGTGFSQWIGPANFTTLCGDIVPNYTANMSTNVPDSCWEEAGSGEVAAGPGGLGASDWRDTDATYAIGNANAINLFAGNSDREWLLSPSFDLSGGTYQLEVNVAVSDWQDGFTAATMGSDDEVQLLISEDGGTTWVNLTTWNVGNQPALAGTEYIADLSGYSGNAQFAIWASDGTTDDLEDYDFLVGKFVVRTPPTCGDVSGITLVSVADTTADISWTIADTETNWEIVVQTTGTAAPGTANDTGTDTTSNPYTATGLTAETVYDVYVRADCNAGDGTNLGEWAGPFSFTTECAVQTAPYTEDFENAGVVPDCWKLAGDENWLFSNTGAGNHIGANGTLSGSTASGGYFAWLDDSDPTATNAELRSPFVDLTPLTTRALSFYLISDNEGANPNSTLTVDVWDGAAWNTVGTYNTNTTGWEERIISLEGITFTGPAQARFLITDSGSFYDDIAIDDVSFFNGPTCYSPSDIVITPAATTADISWTPGTDETAWEIVVQAPLTGEPAGAGTAATNPYTAPGLTPETAYEVYVRSNCTGTGDGFSDWAGPFNFTTTPDCPTVSAITLAGATGTTANISWTAGNSETNWEISIQTPGTGEPAVADDSGTNTASNPYSATGLSPETAYEVYIRAECTLTTEFSTWAGPFNFSTPCAALTPNYVADMSTNAPDAGACWEEAGSGEVVAGPGDIGSSDWQTGSYVFGNSNRINLFAGNTDREWLLSPLFDLSADGYELIVNVAVTDWNSSTASDTMGSDDEVQLLISTDSGATWSNLTTWNATSALPPTGTEYTEDLTGVTNTNVQFAIMASDGTTDDLEDYDFHIGKFEVRTPPACPDVTAITASSITATSASITWTNGGSETAWEVAVQTAGTGEPAAADGSGADSATNPYSATGLSADTAYEVYVRAECTAGVLFGAWAGPFNFSTPCDAISVFPYTEDFEADNTCWSYDLITGTQNWLRDPAGGTGDITGPHGGTGFMEKNYTSSDALFTMPAFDLTAIGADSRIKVWLHRDPDADADDRYRVFANTTNSLTGATQIFELYSNSSIAPVVTGGQGWFEYTINIPSGFNTSDSVYIIFQGTTTAGFSSYDLGIDDFLLEAVPSCSDVADISVSNLTTTSADIAWTNAGSETNWEIAIQAAGTGTPSTADGSGTDTATNPYLATGLTASTPYEVYVRAECAAGVDFGAWIGPVTFTTDCDTVSTFPFTEGFEGAAFPPACWDSFIGTNGEGTGYDWTRVTNSSNSGSASAFVRYEAATPPAEDWLVTPALDLSGLTNPELSFFARQAYGTDYGNVYTIRVSTTDTDHASFTTVQTYGESDFATATGWEKFIVNLAAYNADTTVYVAFVMENDDGDNWYVDDVVVRDNVPTTYTYTDGAWAPISPMGFVTATDDIVIASGDYSLDADMTCNRFDVLPGSGLVIESGNTLTVSDILQLQSSSTSYSSLILDGTVSGSILYDRHVNINGSGTTGSNDLVSAPLTGQAFNTFAAGNPNILNNGSLFLFGPFEKVTGSYVNWAATETSTLDAGIGYRAATTDNSVVTFSGTAENGTITNDIQNTGSNNAEWNLVGNPYPSYLNVQEFLSHDVGGVTNIQLFDASTAAIYGYDGSALNGWKIYNLANITASTLIAPGQGFFVSADATNAGPYNLEFTPAMRSTGSSDDFISGRNAELIYLTLNASTDSKSYTTDFYFNANATLGFDQGYDANIWGNTAPDFAVYSHLIEENSGRPVALQTLNTTDLNDVTIPLGVNANQGEQLRFSIADMTLPTTVKVYLEDVVANTVTLLNDTDYVLTPTTVLSGTGRFFLRTSNDALSTIGNSIDNLDVFTLKASKELVVSGELMDADATLNLFDIQGRLVLSAKLDHTVLQNRMDVSSINSGVYIVTVQDNGQEKTKKVIIN